jgi:DNA mismatch endonuclease (patch repair protein)
MDKVSPEKRSSIMRAVKSKNTKPEILVRKMIWGLGYRGYNIHNASLAGKPDIAFTARKKAIFVNGCFWHGHSCRKGLNRPAVNANYWNEKIEKTMFRDKKNMENLIYAGWSVLILWECELRDSVTMQSKIQQFLGPISI